MSSMYKSKKSKKAKEAKRRPQASASSGGSGSETAYERSRDRTPHDSNQENRIPGSPARGVSGSLSSLPSVAMPGDGEGKGRASRSATIGW